MSKPVVSLYLDTRRPLKSGKYPLKLSITFTKYKNDIKTWQRKYYPFDLAFTVEEYNSVAGSKTKEYLKEYKKKIKLLEAKALGIIDTNPFISPELFEALYTGSYANTALVAPLFKEKIATLKQRNQLSSADLYQWAFECITKFAGDGITLHSIDTDWLIAFEHWMVRDKTKEEKTAGLKKFSITTVGIYLRNLRSIFKIAIERRIIDQANYPFGSNRYVIPSSNNIKKALTADHKKQFINYVPNDAAAKRAKAIWLFSYYCNGINIKDIAYITKENIVDGVLYYVRKKTATTERDRTTMAVPLRKEALAILKQYGTNQPYLFGIIKDDQTIAEQRTAVKNFVRHINHFLEKISNDLKLPVKITTYTARHTVATTLLEAGSDLRDIRETLGHSSFTTTERYIATLDIGRKKKLVDLL